MLVLTTATLRPALLETTYASFRDRLFGGRFPDKLAINIDPVGEPSVTQQEVANKARFYAREIEARLPTRPSLPRAWEWLLSRVGAREEFVLWLEDDWTMTRDVDVEDMLRILRAEPRLALLRLSRFSAGPRECRQWSRTFPIDRSGDFYRCQPENKGMLGFSGNPSIIKGSFLREITPWIVPWGCPEKQVKTLIHGFYGNQEPLTKAIQTQAMERILPSWEYGVYARPGWDGTVKDIGEAWRREHGIKKLHGRETW